MAAAGAKKGSIPKQMKVPRPEQEAPTPRAATEDELLSFFSAMTAPMKK